MIETYGFDYHHKTWYIDTASGVLLKTDNLEPGMQIDSVDSFSGAVFVFQAITGSGTYYGLPPSTPVSPITSSGIDIWFSYKWADANSPLAAKVSYKTSTNIIDY